MAIAVAATRQALADAYKQLGGAGTAWVSLHTADPGTTGASEVSGGGYARKQITWTSGTGGVLTAAAVTFDVPAGTFSHLGLHGAATGTAQYLDKAALAPAYQALGPGTMAVTPSFALS